MFTLGALFYHLRHILHDWPDQQAVEILSQIRPAMDPQISRILINELIVPEQGERALFGARSDFNMMSALAGVERTELQWHELIKAAGLKIDRIWTADPTSDSVLEVSIQEAQF